MCVPAIVPAAASSSSGRQPFVFPVQTSSFSVPITDLVRCCLEFITAKDLSSAGHVHTTIVDFLQRSPDTSQMGLFLMSGRMLEMFSHVVHLRGQVLHVLEAKYRIRVENLTLLNLLEEREYKRMERNARGMLDLILNLNDTKEWAAGIFLYEWVSALPRGLVSGRA